MIAAQGRANQQPIGRKGAIAPAGAISTAFAENAPALLLLSHGPLLHVKRFSNWF
jgi:hypothetical protein